MGSWNMMFMLLLVWVSHIPVTHQLQNYQIQILLQLQKHLQHPPQLTGWETYTGDFCRINLSNAVTLTCQDNLLTELKIEGDKTVNSRNSSIDFNGFPISQQTLTNTFSIDSFFTTLTRLPTLRIVSLVSLGIWGPLPGKISRLHYLEVLDLSSNYIFGAIPPSLFVMLRLQSLTLDTNFFNATIPNWFNSFPNLTVLSLKNNHFNGHFPPSIPKVTGLTDLSLSHNNLFGWVPDLTGLPHLHLLDLRQNRFDSELPMLPDGIVTALLSNNSFSGDIPEEFGSRLTQLQHLDLSCNSLTGTPPAALFSLRNISYLNLGSNSLSGSLSDRVITCGETLGFVDISANELTGGLPSCLEEGSGDTRVVKYGGNCLSVVTKRGQRDELSCHEKKSTKDFFWHKGRVLLVGVIVGFVILVMLVGLLSVVLLRMHTEQSNLSSEEDHRKKLPRIIQENSQQTNNNNCLSAELLANARIISEVAKAGGQGAPAYKTFSIEELEEATNNFDVSNFLGQGSIGKVYKGKLGNGTDIAVRSMCLYRKYSVQSLKYRLDLLAKFHHPHLVTLLGHCIDTYGQEQSIASRIFLVHEYIPSGSFRSHLSENSPQRALTWSDRLAILIDIAKAVHFLHTGVIPGCFSNRLRTNNILLDEHRIAKLGDYGMSVIFQEADNINEGKADGSKLRQMKKPDDDVYNFGFILLEALVGPTVAGRGETFLLNEMTSFGSTDGRNKMVDPTVLTTSCQESLSIAVSITNKCVSPDSATRPSFEDVLWNLQYAAQVQASVDAEQKSDAMSSQYDQPS